MSSSMLLCLLMGQVEALRLSSEHLKISPNIDDDTAPVGLSENNRDGSSRRRPVTEPFPQLVTTDNMQNLASYCQQSMSLPFHKHRKHIVLLMESARGDETPSFISLIKQAEKPIQTDFKTIELTYALQKDTAIFYPKSKLAEGRNALYFAACHQEIQQGFRYNYIMFMDPDAEVVPGSDLAAWYREMFEYEPAFFAPLYHGTPYAKRNPLNLGAMPAAVCEVDHIWMSVHREAADKLLPYETKLDEECWWLSQWRFNAEACFYYQNHTMVSHKLMIKNPGHAAYPRKCENAWDTADGQFRELVPDHLRECVPRKAEVYYSYWGTAMPKYNGSYNYEGWPTTSSTDQCITDRRQYQLEQKAERKEKRQSRKEKKQKKRKEKQKDAQ